MLQGTERTGIFAIRRMGKYTWDNICHSKDGQIHVKLGFLTDWIDKIGTPSNNKILKDQHLLNLY